MMKCSPFSRRFFDHRRGRKHFLRRSSSNSSEDHDSGRQDGDLSMDRGRREFGGLGHGHRHHLRLKDLKHRKKCHKKWHKFEKHHQKKYCRNIFCGNREDENSSADDEGSRKLKDSSYEPKSKAEIITEDGKFQICLDISSYQSSEISVKVIDGKIKVSAVHESMEEDLYEFHEMYRSFKLPDNVDRESIRSSISNVKLVIEGNVNQEENTPHVIDIPVIRLEE